MNNLIEQTISSIEVAEMVEKKHSELLKDIRRYEVQLNEVNIPLVDFFLDSTYKDGKGETRPCYNVTKKGCEFIAHKLTGVKGTEFTAKYINRFHDMEMVIQQEIVQKQDKPNRTPLSSANMMVKNITGVLKEAKVEPIYIAAEVKRLYTELGYPVNAPLVTDKETMSKLYDCTEIAKELGLLSNSGNPHNKAVSAIISKLNINEDEIVTTAFSKNGHDDVTTQYKPSVFDKVQGWLFKNNYPIKIPYTDSKGNYKTYSVSYVGVA